MSKTLILFAHHDVASCVDPHVFRYLQELRTLGDSTLIFVSDVHPPRSFDTATLDQLAVLCDEVYCEHQPSRDFGSWRIAWEIAQRNDYLSECNRVLFANDSVYGGLFPLTEMWSTFKDADMYGAVESEEGGFSHFFESFFLVFDLNDKTRAFLDQFWDGFEFVDDVYELIRRYEIGIAEQAAAAGLTMKPFVSVADFKNSYQQVKGRSFDEDIAPEYAWGGTTWYFWYGLIHYHRFPFLKVKVARMKERGLREVIERHTDYPYQLIESHVDRINGVSWLTQRGDPRMACDPKSM